MTRRRGGLGAVLVVVIVLILDACNFSRASAVTAVPDNGQRIYVVYPDNQMVAFRIGANLAWVDQFTGSRFVRASACPAYRRCLEFRADPYSGGGHTVYYGARTVIYLDPYVYKWTQAAKDHAVRHEVGHAFSFGHRPTSETPRTMMFPYVIVHRWIYPYDGWTRQPCYPYACGWLPYQRAWLAAH